MLEKDYMGVFTFIFLICPTFEYNTTYRSWKYESDEDYIVIPCAQEHVEYWLKYVVKHCKGTNSLIILDDCASSNSMKNRSSELVMLGFSARHYGISTIVITQQLTSIAKPYRDNLTKMAVFYNSDGDDMHMLFHKYLEGTTQEERASIKSTLKKQKYSKLEVNLICPYSQAVR